MRLDLESNCDDLSKYLYLALPGDLPTEQCSVQFPGKPLKAQRFFFCVKNPFFQERRSHLRTLSIGVFFFLEQLPSQ